MINEPDFINLEKVISQLEIKPNMTVADFGAGHGFFTIAFGKIVAPSGQVFAVDVLPQALEAVKSKARLEGLFNIKTIHANLEKPNGSTLKDESCDFVFIANVLFQVPDKLTLLNEARRILKPDGRLTVVEWKPYTSLGPKKEYRLTEEDLRQMILAVGFNEIKTINAGSHHYGFIFNKKLI
ncbi:MAG: methyltransferase domain-containing protein [Candidatus Azambacteria bacterium]|nr:methyltransferase domain-containing protein [Candidatus Azambacteria bacterium]